MAADISYNWADPKQARYARTEKGIATRRRANAASRIRNRESRRLSCEAWRRKYPIRAMISQVRNRAKREGIECTLDKQDWDMPMPAICPVLGIPLIYGGKGQQAGTASLDRIDPSKGYTRDNVMIISFRANTLKSDGTLDEFRAIVAFYSTL